MTEPSLSTLYKPTDPALSPARPLAEREWLVTNGLSGYASGTVDWANTWRYHGLLIAAEPAPLGRMMMLRQMHETVILPDERRFSLGGAVENGDRAEFAEFRLDHGLPVWRYRLGDLLLERRLFMAYRRNTTYLMYRVVEGTAPVSLLLQPYIQIRPHDAANDSDTPPLDYRVGKSDIGYDITAGPALPSLRLTVPHIPYDFSAGQGKKCALFFQQDADRGYHAAGISWTPGTMALTLSPGQDAAVIASTEAWERIEMSPARALAAEIDRREYLVEQALPAARSGLGARLVLAADQFLFEPVGRQGEKTRVAVLGDSVRAVIAGYHWFTDWGRDTFISLEGLTLVTGRVVEAKWILRSYGHYIRNGLVPNMFPEGSEEGLYHTADASLWFFHAVDRYVSASGDRETLRLLLPALNGIIAQHMQGTRFGIGVDPADGLLRQGEDGYQLTWMDAKVDGWVVTPRRGKAVELNGLWHNALCLLAQWLAAEGRAAESAKWQDQAEKTRLSFNRKFWNATGWFLYDVIDGPDGPDAACRPNQLLSFSLRYPVLDRDKWDAVLQVVEEKLLTPFGLRTLSRDHPGYQPRYFGDLRARDAAYHQGTVWPWLIGPFIDAWLAIHPGDKEGARAKLREFANHLDDACIGTISEICDAEPPYTPRGCISQAWSVAEILRCWVKTA